MSVERRTIDLSRYPDLVVIYLGMRVNAWRGLKRLMGLGPQISRSWKEKPDGLLLHEDSDLLDCSGPRGDAAVLA